MGYSIISAPAPEGYPGNHTQDRYLSERQHRAGKKAAMALQRKLPAGDPSWGGEDYTQCRVAREPT